MGHRRTPRPEHTILCVLCGFKFKNAAGFVYHLCAVHTGLPDEESPNKKGYFVCSSCGNQKKRKRRKEFHRDQKKHACFTSYLRDNSLDFVSFEVVVVVRLARRLAKAMYLKEEGQIDLEMIDEWLPAGTGFGDSVPHVEEYHCTDEKNPTEQLFGLESVLDYLNLEAFDLAPASPVRRNRQKG